MAACCLTPVSRTSRVRPRRFASFSSASTIDRVSTSEVSVSERTALRADTKQCIAARALDILGDGFRGSLYLDAGTTNAVGIQTMTLQHEGWQRDTSVAEPTET